MNGIWNLSRQEFIFFPALVIISKPLLSSVHNDIWETIATPLGIFIIIRDLKTQKATKEALWISVSEGYLVVDT